MASGYGFNGRNRCFDFWQDFEKCYILAPTDDKNKCVEKRDDYLECLHHFKEVSRVSEIQKREKQNYQNAKLDGSSKKFFDLS